MSISFGSFVFMLMLWMGGHLIFGTLNEETFALFDTFSSFEPWKWLGGFYSMIWFRYDILDTNTFTQIVRTLLVTMGIVMFMVLIHSVLQLLIFGVTAIFNGIRGVFGIRGVT